MQRNQRIALSFGTPMGLLVLWEILVRATGIDPLFLVPPSQVAGQLYALVVSGVLLTNLGISLQTLVVGFGLAIVCGVVVGVLNGWYLKLYYSLDFLLTSLYSTPVIVMLPLLIIWFGLGRPSQIAIVFLGSFFPMVFTVSAGIRAVDQQLVRVGRVYGARDWDIFRDVALPSAVPYILAGLRVSLGRALVSLIFAEWFAGSGGIGYLVAQYGQQFQTGRLFSVIVVVIAVSLLAVEGMKRLESRYLARVRVGNVME